MSRRSLCDIGDGPLGLAFAFLSFRDVCVSVRRTCRHWNETVFSEEFWALKCSHSQGADWEIRKQYWDPTLAPPDASTAASATAAFSHPLRCVSDCVAATVENLLPPWRLALTIFSCVGVCPHLSRGVAAVAAIRVARTCSADLLRLAAGCTTCGAPSEFVCSRCAVPFCSRTHRGCMALHSCASTAELTEEEVEIVRALAPSEVATVIVPDAAPRVGLSRAVGMFSTYCYACSRSYSGASRPVVPRRIAHIFAPRDLRPFANHFAAFARCECPHVDSALIARAAARWRSARRALANGRCYHNRDRPQPPPMMLATRTDADRAESPCTSMKVYACLSCFTLWCAPEHLVAHALASNHFVFIGLRSLNIICCSCDRAIGFGGTDADTRLGGELRAAFKSADLFSQHMYLAGFDVELEHDAAAAATSAPTAAAAGSV